MYFFNVRIQLSLKHDDVIKWKHFPRYWPFVRGIHRSPVNSPHKGQWRGALMFSLICVWINDWVNNGEAGDLRRYRAHYDVTVMICSWPSGNKPALIQAMTRRRQTTSHNRTNADQDPWWYMRYTLKYAHLLTHWGRYKMAAISQTIFSNAFSWMKIYEFRLRFHWSLFLVVQTTISQHWFN